MIYSTIEIGILLSITFGGVLFASLFGWTKTTETFNAKQFISSIMIGILSGLTLIIGVISSGEALTYITYILLFLGAAGADAILERGLKTVSRIT